MDTNEWSIPETELFDRIATALDDGDGAVLATVVAVEGSAYRRPGAKMLIRPDGGAGSITAGCLEDEVRDIARDVLATGEARVETWDLTGDDDVWGMGVGCNGVITVLLEPLSADYAPVVAARERGDAVAVATVVGGDLPVATRGRYAGGDGDDRGVVAGDLPDWVAEAVREDAQRLLETGGGDVVAVESEDGATAEVFVDGVRPPPEVVVFGSGHDVRPVVELATLVEFRVTVVSFRGVDADGERVSGADEVISASPRDVPDLREWDDDTHAVVMTHNFVDDRLTLDALLETPVSYIGLMGPRKRLAEMREAFVEEGRAFTTAELDRIYTPIGVNLGGDTPYRIAYSIVAELLAVANDREPAHLADLAGPIHDRAGIDSP
ncbi:XdhC family protein [Halobaculum sp. CBA1158]|uniref:XdhC family protein n=1 Tax=Halobaculum sp. CBA1158 TaxID=2904243 RepID=UPI001F1B0ACB|nr:XdhC/CoxI family protein [Halobaculum sp. CBA1158]UIP00457.1 XdhC family protein [Halobaculum sp. CBA1158]